MIRKHEKVMNDQSSQTHRPTGEQVFVSTCGSDYPSVHLITGRNRLQS